MFSKRLAMIANFVPDYSSCADIGTDHAYLLIELAYRNPNRKLIGVELNRKPWLSAKDNIEKAGLNTQVQLQFGNGLTKIEPGEIDTVVIAGMGSKTIIDILESRPEVVRDLDRLIIQPMIGVEHVRRWLIENNFYLADEELVFEDGQFYQIILACSGQTSQLEEIFLILGPKLVEKSHPLLINYLDYLISKYEEIIKQMIYFQTESEGNSQRFAEIKNKISKLKEVKNNVCKS